MTRRSSRWGSSVPATATPRHDQFEVWRTPGHVVEQGLWSARLLGGVTRPRRIADLGAGSGPFGQRCRRVFKGAHQLAVEIREEERPGLAWNYDEVIVGDMFDSVERLRRYAPQLVVSNPPYSVALAVLLLALSIVAVGGHVLLFLRSTFGSSAEAWEQLRDQPPTHEFSVAGRPNMRQGTGATGQKLGGDFVPHTWLLFERGHRPHHPSWERHPLPPLASEDLSWSVIPGSERPTPEFPSIYMPSGISDVLH